jgi:hypothetical protein
MIVYLKSFIFIAILRGNLGKSTTKLEKNKFQHLGKRQFQIITRFWVPCDLSSKNFIKKTLLFEAEIYVPGYAQNAGFCTIYPRASGGQENFRSSLGQLCYKFRLSVIVFGRH